MTVSPIATETSTSLRKRIVILGGGLGAMAAAYELTNQPGWYERYEITIYQLGWRLGGKGASGHNADKYQRIEEHGLHIWWGFYDNSFAMMKACYAEVGLPNLTFDDAFQPHDLITFMDQLNGKWFKHEINFPRNSQSPGSIDTATDLWEALRKGISWLHSAFLDHKQLLQTSASQPDTTERSSLAMVDDLGEAALHLAYDKMTSPGTSAVGRTGSSAPWITDGPELVKLLSTFRSQLKIPALLAGIVDEIRWFYILADFGITVFIGLLTDHVFTNPDGLNSLEDEEFSAWLIRHGINQKITLPSALVRGLYDAAFCFIGGDPQKPNIGAGAMLRATLRMVFTYKGAFMWKMQGGMGDVIFAPLYLMLQQRGQQADAASGRTGSLQFEFFHNVQNVGLTTLDGKTPDGPAAQIESITMCKQANIVGGVPYNPVYTDETTGLPVWPDEPLFDQLVEGEAIKNGPPPHVMPYNLESRWTSWPGVGTVTLRRGTDFDYVVMGISLGAFPYICQELINDPRQNGAWANMVKYVQTTRTQGVQLWFGPTSEQLGWVAKEPAVMDAYVDPLNSWADMSQVLPHESWPPQDPPQMVAYFCGPMLDDPHEPSPPDDSYPLTQTTEIAYSALSFWNQWYSPLFPNATAPGGGFDWNKLWAPADLKGQERFGWQYFRANIEPSERYVLAVAGSFKYRLKPDQSGYANLFLTGDWTNNGMNFGCVESATMGGLGGARGLLAALPSNGDDSGKPILPPDPGSSSPPYIEYGGLQVLAPPYALGGVTVQIYPLLSKHSVLQSAVDKYLNAASGPLRFEAIGDLVFLQLGYIASNSSIDPPDSTYGYGPETSATFMFPVLAYDIRQPLEVSIGLFMPYILVDNSLSLCTGREVFGIPKEIGWFQYNLGSQGSPATAETLVFPTLSPTTPLQRRVLFSIQKSALTAGPTTENWTAGAMPIDLMLSRLYDVRPDGGVPMSGQQHKRVVDGLLSGAMPIYSLLQIRNPQQPSQSIYSQVTKAVMAVTSIQDGGLVTGAHDVTLYSYGSHPIGPDLFGLPSGASTVRSLFPFWLRFDSQLKNGS